MTCEKCSTGEQTAVAVAAPPKPVRIDLGCGPNKPEGWIGLDAIAFPGVDHQLHVGAQRWPFEDGSVDEARASHLVEHLTWPERVFFFNELHRVLKKGGQAQIIIPHWRSVRYYGDPTHQAPMSEFAWLYLDANWRQANAPHAPYTCDFANTYSYSLTQYAMGKSQDWLNFGLTHYGEVAADMMAMLTKK
jgi:predicted SAM-dependent methyltransferase